MSAKKKIKVSRAIKAKAKLVLSSPSKPPTGLNCTTPVRGNVKASEMFPTEAERAAFLRTISALMDTCPGPP